MFGFKHVPTADERLACDIITCIEAAPDEALSYTHTVGFWSNRYYFTDEIRACVDGVDLTFTTVDGVFRSKKVSAGGWEGSVCCPRSHNHGALIARARKVATARKSADRRQRAQDICETLHAGAA